MHVWKKKLENGNGPSAHYAADNTLGIGTLGPFLLKWLPMLAIESFV